MLQTAFHINELAVVGDTIGDDDRVVYLLASLPESYDMLVTALEANETVPGMKTVIERLTYEEKKLQDRTTPSSSTGGGAMTARHQRKSGPRCYFCKKHGHIQRNCREREKSLQGTGEKQSTDKKKPQHKANSVETRNIDTDSDEAGLVVGRALSTGENPSRRGKWIIDSGATSHICNTRDLFHRLYPLKSPFEVILGDGHKLTAAAQGTVKLTMKSGHHGTRKCTLHDVLYIPELSYNLLSVSKAVDRGNSVKFEESSCIIRGSNHKLITVAEKIGGLYQVDTVPVYINSATTTCQETTKEDIWHRRFGHLNIRSLQKLARDSLVDDFDFASSSDIQFCESCLEGKQHRSSFPAQSETRAKEPLELVHSDICGKVNSRSLSGAEYFMTFIDDCTRYVWIYLLKHKSEAFEKFREWKASVELETGRKLKVFRSDNGGEFTSTEFESYLKREGIKHQLTIPKCPEQNGIAERMNRTLMEMVRSMLASSKLPQKFWAEALSTAVYIRNRCPTKAIPDKTPCEALTGVKPGVGHLRIFGCTAYRHISKDERQKLDSKSQKCIFMGYSDQRKGYRLYDIQKERIVFSCDVAFNETVSGFETKANNTSNTTYVQFDLVDNDECEEIADEDQTTSDNEDRVEEPAPRRSTREHKRPDYYGVYVNLAEVGNEPTTVSEALTGSDKEKWKSAMDAEFESLTANHVWELTDPPRDCNIVKCKWVFKHKVGPNGLIERHKARLVAQGYSQRQGQDYEETFSPVVRFESIRTIIALAIQKGLKIHQMDVETAFLNGELTEEIYMKQPEGFVEKGRENQVCKLTKSIYGLKQSPRCWNYVLDTQLKSMGFAQTKSDPCIYVSTIGEPFIIAIYVDDIVLVSKTDQRLTEVKREIESKFKVKDLGELHYFLGVKVVQNTEKQSIWLGQPSYIKQLLEQFNMSNAKATKTPVNPGFKLSKGTEDSEYMDIELYQSAVGKLLYLSTRTRPDISFAVSSVARYTAKPTVDHWKAVKHILRYLIGTINYGLLYSRTSSVCLGYSDSDWGGDLDDRKSTSGYVFQIGGGPVSWQSRKQSCVALSTSEAEYIALTSAAQEAIWLRQLLSELEQEPEKKVVIYEDNQSTICLSKNPQFHGRSKHIAIKYHFIRDQVKEGTIDLKYCRTEEMLADALTKGLSEEKFHLLRQKIGIEEMDTSSIVQ